jgi:hypothetical protein
VKRKVRQIMDEFAQISKAIYLHPVSQTKPIPRIGRVTRKREIESGRTGNALPIRVRGMMQHGSRGQKKSHLS